MAKEEKVYKVAPRVSLASKGVIIDDGTSVTTANFENETVFNTLVKAGKIVTSEDYNKKWEELNRPQEDSKATAQREHDEKMQKAIDAAVEKATAKATEEARKKFEEEYAAKEAERQKAEEEAKKKAEEEAGNQQGGQKQ